MRRDAGSNVLRRAMNPKHAIPHSKTHRAPINTLATTGRNPMSKRRSNRMQLHAAIGLEGEDRQKCSFSMKAKATNLNKHGAAVHLSRDLAVGTVLSVKNQRGIQVPARVVALLAAKPDVSTYGIEFVELDENAKNFWGISFPASEKPEA